MNDVTLEAALRVARTLLLYSSKTVSAAALCVKACGVSGKRRRLPQAVSSKRKQ